MSMHQQNFAAVGDSLGEVFDFLSRRCEELGVGHNLKLKLHLAAEELFTNIVKYATLESGAPFVAVGLQRSGPDVELTIEDHGAAYNPFEHVSAEAPGAPLTDRAVGGLGVLLVHTLAARTGYSRVDGCNRVVLTFLATGC